MRAQWSWVGPWSDMTGVLERGHLGRDTDTEREGNVKRHREKTAVGSRQAKERGLEWTLPSQPSHNNTSLLAPRVQAPSRLAGGNTFLLCKPPALGLCYGSLSKLTGGVLKPFQLLLLPEDPFHGCLRCYQQAARPCSAPWHPLGSLQLRELCPHNLNPSAPLWVRRSHRCPFSSPSPVPEL